MKIEIEINENDLKSMIFDHLRSKLGDIELNKNNIEIMVKSKQNYKSEWEIAKFKAIYKES